MGLAAHGARTHPLVWYLISLVLLISFVSALSRSSSFRSSFVCLQNVNTSKRSKRRACTPPPCDARACQACMRAKRALYARARVQAQSREGAQARQWRPAADRYIPARCARRATRARSVRVQCACQACDLCARARVQGAERRRASKAADKLWSRTKSVRAQIVCTRGIQKVSPFQNDKFCVHFTYTS